MSELHAITEYFRRYPEAAEFLPEASTPKAPQAEQATNTDCWPNTRQ
jgi:hypothetical protein